MSTTQTEGARAASRPRRRLWPAGIGILVLALVVLIALWDWNWFRPLVAAQLSTAIGRQVTVGHFDLKLGWNPVAILDDVEIANPAGFDDTPYLAHIDRLAVTADARAYLHGRTIVLPRIELDRPDANVIRLADGKTNYDVMLAGGPSSGPSPKIGDLVITDGHAHVVDPKLKADVGIDIATKANPAGKDQLVLGADGTYAGQKIAGQAVAGALLSLRDAANPYPIDAHVQNGPTKLDLTGTVQDPLHFKGTDLTLHLAGPDMVLLTPLVGFPIPKTPNYNVDGQLSYADRRIRLDRFRGRVGSSDVAGTIAVDPGTERPDVRMDLTSHRVDLADLGGFIGSQPGRVGTPGQSAEEKQAVRKAEANSELFPTKKISIPQLRSADFHITYDGAQIIGQGVPFDSLKAKIDIVDGTIRLHPVGLGVGSGTIGGDITLVPLGADGLDLDADIALNRVDVGRMLNATGAVKGAGRLGGRIELKSKGDSVATLLGHGDGRVRMMMAGGDLSALIVDLSGLEFGNALLSALGLPNRAQLQCFAADLPLHDGTLDTKTLLVVTTEGDIDVTGRTNLLRESLDYRLRTASRHFSVGSLPADIGIGGTYKNPSILPNLAELGGRAAAAVGLGVLLTPLAALLPTIQFGTGDDEANACVTILRQNGKQPTAASTATAPKPSK